MSIATRNRRNYEWCYRRYGRVCVYCADYADTIDHLIPHSFGGDNSRGNLVPACGMCNGIASDKIFSDFGEKWHFIREERYRKGLSLGTPPVIDVWGGTPPMEEPEQSEERQGDGGDEEAFGFIPLEDQEQVDNTSWQCGEPTQSGSPCAISTRNNPCRYHGNRSGKVESGKVRQAAISEKSRPIQTGKGPLTSGLANDKRKDIPKPISKPKSHKLCGYMMWTGSLCSINIEKKPCPYHAGRPGYYKLHPAVTDLKLQREGSVNWLRVRCYGSLSRLTGNLEFWWDVRGRQSPGVALAGGEAAADGSGDLAWAEAGFEGRFREFGRDRGGGQGAGRYELAQVEGRTVQGVVAGSFFRRGDGGGLVSQRCFGVGGWPLASECSGAFGGSRTRRLLKESADPVRERGQGRRANDGVRRAADLAARGDDVAVGRTDVDERCEFAGGVPDGRAVRRVVQMHSARRRSGHGERRGDLLAMFAREAGESVSASGLIAGVAGPVAGDVEIDDDQAGLSAVDADVVGAGGPPVLDLGRVGGGNRAPVGVAEGGGLAAGGAGEDVPASFGAGEGGAHQRRERSVGGVTGVHVGLPSGGAAMLGAAEPGETVVAFEDQFIRSG